jgi:cyclophilin family peptidyl-prolyl cis-trans isomerase
MIEENYFVDAKFFRVVPGFIAQFGLSNNVAATAQWATNIADDPIRHTNTMGTLCFAAAGPATRSEQLFFNMVVSKSITSETFSFLAFPFA